ncbi:VOC family protein [Reinekea marina]|uniref:VOC family protein n=1 Tax=Reinekea marina TaxID=1310421 RepID=A0ABV7WPZ6_9GAMM|nr:VOC family protein [Reinekea marina]MDN3647815.1 VOC family protein [Reinekea marina]
MTPIFHLACHITNINEAKAFYGTLLGCEQGRETETWVDFNFFGHQLSLHLGEPFQVENSGQVAEVKVPMPHFGAILPMQQWQALADRLTKAGISFEYGPTIRYQGEPGEQGTMFFRDPSGNPIELKGFESFEGVFEK